VREDADTARSCCWITLVGSVDASDLLGSLVIVVVDAKDEAAERFYAGYDFVTLDAEGWPGRMFLAIATAKSALDP
jgi:hypothetical protein